MRSSSTTSYSPLSWVEKIYLSLTATTINEKEPQLLNQEIVRDHVATIDNALAIIKAAILNANEAS